MKRKFISIICIFLLLIASFSSNVFASNAEIQINVPQRTYNKNETFNVTIIVKNASFNIVGYAISYPKDTLVLEKIDNYKDISRLLQRNDKEKGTIHGVWYTTADKIVADNNGLVLSTLTFRAKENTYAEFAFTTIPGNVDFDNKSVLLAENGEFVKVNQSVTYLKHENLKDETTAECDRLIEKISIPVTLNDKEAIRNAINIYNTLTPTQKSMLKNETKLINAQHELKRLTAKDDFIDAMHSIPDCPTLKDRPSYNKALDAYQLLTKTAKNTLPENLLSRFTVLQKEMNARLKNVLDFERQIKQLPKNIEQNEKHMIPLVVAQQKYMNLNEEEKQVIDKTLVDHFIHAKEQAEMLNHESMGLKIENIPFNVRINAKPVNTGGNYTRIEDATEKNILGIYNVSFSIYSPRGETPYTLKQDAMLIFPLQTQKRYKFFDAYKITDETLLIPAKKGETGIYVPITSDGIYSVVAMECIFQKPTCTDYIVLGITFVITISALIFMLVIHSRTKYKTS